MQGKVESAMERMDTDAREAFVGRQSGMENVLS
jgi:hypothetical protein